MTSLKIATYNVHGWYDDDGLHNLGRVVDLYREEKPDILCLQEIPRFSLMSFVELSGLQFFITWGPNAILSNMKLEEMEEDGLKSTHPRFITCRVTPDDLPDFYLTCLHLDHRTEPSRMDELRKIETRLKFLRDRGSPQVWTGDFNSLTREDYTEAEWESVTDVRKRNNWESPQTQVTSYMKDLGFQDAWTQAGRPGKLSTCRFNTRIDYMFLNEDFQSVYQLKSVLHHPNQASDHSLVLATFNACDYPCLCDATDTGSLYCSYCVMYRI